MVTTTCPVCGYYGYMERVGEEQPRPKDQRYSNRQLSPGLVCCPNCGVALSIEVLLRKLNEEKKQ